MMDKPAIIAAEAFAKCGYPTDVEALFLCELDGTEEEVQDQMQQVDALVRKNNATVIHIARDEEERLQLWKGRKSAFPAVGRLSPDYYCIDGTIPRRHLSRVLQQMNTWSQEFNLRIANVFHAGDGNLHPLILFDASIEGELEKTEQLGAKILELCVEVGGTITGEHGVGMEKINQMCVQFSNNEITQFHAIKNAFDPQSLLNPGKAIPTLNRCAEYGAQAVSNKEKLNITGNGSKSFLGVVNEAPTVKVSEHSGIISYEPTELVITTLKEVNNALKECKQTLAFEPPSFGDNATLGGTVACALSGPAKPYLGGTRDYILG